MKKTLLMGIGGHIQVRDETGTIKVVPFPICLAIWHIKDVMTSCPNFIVNIEERWVYVKTDRPLPVGTSVLMHFYIPPEEKLLARIGGAVAPLDQNGKQYQEGMLIKFGLFSRGETERLADYVEGKRPLTDKVA
jgi:hypothetical protein